MTKKQDWINEITRLISEGWLLTDLKLQLMSPQFTYGGWRICPEHQRGFKSVVVKWIGKPGEEPQPPPAAIECRQSDVDKSWKYRVMLHPSELSGFLDSLDSGGLQYIHVFMGHRVQLPNENTRA